MAAIGSADNEARGRGRRAAAVGLWVASGVLLAYVGIWQGLGPIVDLASGSDGSIYPPDQAAYGVVALATGAAGAVGAFWVYHGRRGGSWLLAGAWIAFTATYGFVEIGRVLDVRAGPLEGLATAIALRTAVRLMLLVAMLFVLLRVWRSLPEQTVDKGTNEVPADV